SDPFGPTAAGTWCFRAVYNGDTNYTSSTDSDSGGCFTVTKAAQTISWTQSFSPCVTCSTTLTATASPTLPVAYSVSTATVCNIPSGTTALNFTGVGVCKINANQAGNTSYNAAPQVQASITVTLGDGRGTMTAPAGVSKVPDSASVSILDGGFSPSSTHVAPGGQV